MINWHRPPPPPSLLLPLPPPPPPPLDDSPCSPYALVYARPGGCPAVPCPAPSLLQSVQAALIKELKEAEEATQALLLAEQAGGGTAKAAEAGGQGQGQDGAGLLQEGAAAEA